MSVSATSHGPRGKPVWTDGIPPGAEEYVALRAACGLGARSIKAAATGLPHALFVTLCRDGPTLVAMARLVGDGGTFALLVDVMVAPRWQGRGLGRAAVDRTMGWARATLPATCLVCLHTKDGSEPFYEDHGFRRVPGLMVQL